MTLLDFKLYIESLPNNIQFKYGISEPFSWRGSYDEVAFSIIEKETSKQDVLDKINLAYTQTFIGYKGGKFEYYDQTPVNFESGTNRFTDKSYVAEKISEIEGGSSYRDLEEKLVKIAFK